MDDDVRKPDGYDPARDGAHGFSIDDRSYPCFPLGSVWNGFDNVSISPETHALMVSDMRSESAVTDEDLGDFATLEPGDDGRICLGWCYATVLDD